MFLKYLIVAVTLIYANTLAHQTCNCPCINLDAAITMNGNVFLFRGDNVMTLDHALREVRVEVTTEKWPGFPARIDASFVWPPNRNMPYFFHGDQMHVLRGTTVDGPYPGSQWSSFVSEGMDAVAFAGDVVYFMRGCQYQYRHSNYGSISTTRELSAVNLPCDIDAAFTHGGNMIAIKGNEYWSFNGHTATGPFPISELIELHSWRL